MRERQLNDRNNNKNIVQNTRRQSLYVVQHWTDCSFLFISLIAFSYVRSHTYTCGRNIHADRVVLCMTFIHRSNKFQNWFWICTLLHSVYNFRDFRLSVSIGRHIYLLCFFLLSVPSVLFIELLLVRLPFLAFGNLKCFILKKRCGSTVACLCFAL